MQRCNRYIAKFIGVLGTIHISAAHAQVIDYDSLRDMFGEPVTVSATGKPQRVSEAPVDMDIITSDEIQRSGARDIPQLLRKLVGVSVTQNFIGQADVSLRGYNQPYANRLLVLIDGRQVYQDSYGMTLWNALPVQLDEIAQIEVVRGPNSSLFGFNASAGVVNIVTFNPMHKNLSEVKGGAGTQNYQELSGIFTQKFSDNFAARISAGEVNSDGYDRDRMEVLSAVKDSDGLELANGNFDGFIALAERQSLRLDAGINTYQADNTIPFHVAVNAEAVNRHYKADYFYETPSSGVVGVSYYHNDHDYKSDGSNFVPGLAIQPLVNKLDVGKLSWLISPSVGHTLRLAAEARRDSIEGTLVGGSQDSRFAMDVYSFSQMWNWDITDKLSLTQSLRFDKWSTEDNVADTYVDQFLNTNAMDQNPGSVEYSYNLGMAYSPDEANSYRIATARGLHIPSLIELTTYFPTAVSETYGNPSLNPEVNTTYEVSYNHKFDNHGVKQLKTTLFFEEIEDLIVTTGRALGGSGGAMADFTYENAGKSRTYGVQLGLDGTIGSENLRWNANYTALIADDDDDGVADHYINFSHNEPVHRLNVAVDYSWNDFDFTADGHYVSGVKYTGITANDFTPMIERDIDSYFVLNGAVSYNITDKSTLQLSGINLVDRHQERPTFPFTGGFGVIGSNDIGRTVLITFRHEL